MDKQQPACATCGTTVQLLRCAKCKTVYYCSTSHQHMDWPNHKQECRQLAKQKNNNRQLQQLQQAVAAATLKGTTTPMSAAGSTDFLVNGDSDVASTVPNEDDLPAIISHGEYGSSPMSVLLGTNENEIMNTQAETVSQRNSNGIGYMGNVDANSTTMEQMFNCNSLQANELHESHDQELQNRVITMPQQLPQPQHHQYLQQQHINQNIYNNQNEKSSSYQIGRADENGFGNANERRYEDLCRNIINDMNQYGLSVVDDFLGMEKGLQILNEVHRMYAAGVFKDGQLVSNLIAEQDLRTIRGDKITWVKGVEQGCSNVGYLINQIDAVICRANTMKNNGKLGNYNIKERTKAMVACYPGSGSHYVMHVDNPNRDGRVITAIYYLNVNWDTKRSGGVLRIFPEHGGSVADIEPKFDRLIFFWSDKRNPHEVQPAHRTRYAITVWYFDANEREAALNRCRQYKNNTSNTTTKTANVNHKANTHTNASDICT